MSNAESNDIGWPSPTSGASSERRSASPSEFPGGSQVQVNGSGVTRKRKRPRLTEENDPARSDEEENDHSYSPTKLDSESEAVTEAMDTDLEELEAELEQAPLLLGPGMGINNSPNGGPRNKRGLTSWIWDHGWWAVKPEDGGGYWMCNLCKTMMLAYEPGNEYRIISFIVRAKYSKVRAERSSEGYRTTNNRNDRNERTGQYTKRIL
jgi:hypothetical protein